MKKLLVLFIAILTIGCTTNRPVLLDTHEHVQPNAALNPSLSIPDKGLHPFAGISLGLKPDRIDNNSYDYEQIGISGGILYQTSIEREVSLAFFSSLNSDINYSYYEITPTIKNENRMSQDAKDKTNKDTYSISGEINLKCGPSFRFYPCVLSIYGIGTIQFEKGSFPQLRKKIDTISNYYNIETSDISYGAGYGIDISFGKIRETDVGAYIEQEYFYLNPQSEYSIFLDDYLEDNYHINIYSYKGKLLLHYYNGGLYADYSKFRLLLTVAEGISFNILYKFL
jgi:hypothetical protein